MDLARSTSAQPLRTIGAFLAFVVLTVCARAESVSSQAKQLFDEARWQELVTLLQSPHLPSADVDFYYGTALAHLQRWPEAYAVFESGRRQAPADKRFPIELVGVEFKQKQYSRAAGYLRTALRLDPGDAYASDFLGTVYFLQGNLEAALKYWNKVEKPRLEDVLTEPKPDVDPELLDRAFVFSPATTLISSQFLTSDIRIRNLGIFPSYRLDLEGRPDGKFDLAFRARERNGWGSSTWEALFLVFRGLPFQTIYGDYYNLGKEAINIRSLFRWDAEKRRVLANVSAPLRGNPKQHFDAGVDLRSENWAIQESFTGPSTLLGSFNMRREAFSANFASFESGRWQWSVGGELSHRDFRDVVPGPALTPDLLSKGYQLKQISRLDASLWHFPERRMTVDVTASSDLGRIWSDPQHTFFKLQGSARWHWFPQGTGDDYELTQQFRSGKTFGDVPFDELFMLGIERDNDLWMRGHIGTRDGRKGSAPLGRAYVLANSEIDKRIYSNGLFTMHLGPFVDTGKITDDTPGLGSGKWLWDVGAQVKLRVFGSGIGFSYGKDLRSGNNAFYVTLSQ
jgi:hypothetical protein